MSRRSVPCTAGRTGDKAGSSGPPTMSQDRFRAIKAPGRYLNHFSPYCWKASVAIHSAVF